MLNEIINYVNFDGENVSENAYFDLDSFEIMDLMAQGFQKKLEEVSKLASENTYISDPEYAKAMRGVVYAIMEKAYGVRQGDEFVKTIEVKNPLDDTIHTVSAFERWRNTLACRKLVNTLVTSDTKIIEFISNIFPPEIMNKPEVKNALESVKN